MHHIHHTQGFILSSRNIGEANKILTIYTREMGLLRAVVQGVRLNKSKLRFSLQDFSYNNIDLVRGKDFWRITSSSYISSFPLARRNKFSLVLIMRICRLLERLCIGEHANEIIFDDMIQSFNFLDNENISVKEKEALELHLVLRIMHSLGYIEDVLILKKYLSIPFKNFNIETILGERQSIISHINKALGESQL
jgi:DNA repair protein RecO (recombination protein O)